MDLQTHTDTITAGEDRSWLAMRKGMDTCRPGVIDFSAFTFPDEDAEHPTGYVIPSGTRVIKDPATERYGPYIAAGAGSLTDATAEQWDLDLDDATSCIFQIAGENVSIAAADTAAQAKTKLLALAVFSEYGTSDITATKPTGTTFRFVFPTGDEVPNPVVGAATGGSTPTVLATITTEGAPAQGGGLETATQVGLLFNSVQAKLGNLDGIAACTVFWEGVVRADRLPDDTFSDEVDTAFVEACPHILFENVS